MDKTTAKNIEPIRTLTSQFPLWQELRAPLNEYVIGESDYSKESLDFLLQLYAAKYLDWKELRAFDGGKVLISVLHDELVENMTSVTRRIQSLKGLVTCEKAGPDVGKHGNAKYAIISDDGVKIIKPVWQRYQKLADFLLDGVSQLEQQACYRVNLMIREKINNHRLHSYEDSTSSLPIYIVLGIYELRRDLLAKGFRFLHLGKIDEEMACVLLESYALLKPSQPHGTLQPGRFVSCDGTLTLLAHRMLPKLEKLGFIEMSASRVKQGKLAAFRLTEEGIRYISPIWGQLGQESEAWLSDVTVKDREIHLKVSGYIASKLRPSWKSLLKDRII